MGIATREDPYEFEDVYLEGISATGGNVSKNIKRRASTGPDLSHIPEKQRIIDANYNGELYPVPKAKRSRHRRSTIANDGEVFDDMEVYDFKDPDIAMPEKATNGV